VRFDYVDPPELTRPWLLAQCRHDLALMIDGDEVPGTALLRALPRLMSDDSVVQFRIPRRWCFPDEAHWLAERPWWPDYQPGRLIRRGPWVDFDLAVHGGVRRTLPARYLDEPVYHLACALVPFGDRRRRVRRYDAARPGMIAVGGGPMNDTLYLPEHFATLRPVPVPQEDRARVAAVAGAARTPPPPGAAPHLRRVSAAEIAAHAPADPVAAQGYRAALRVAELDRRTAPGNNTTLMVEVKNTGAAPLLHRDEAGVQIRVGLRLLHAEGGEPVDDWALSPLPCDIPAGETRLVEALVRVPGVPGRYLLEADLVNEVARWFGCAVRSDLLVASRWGRYTV
jgi:hypothetical protein